MSTRAERWRRWLQRRTFGGGLHANRKTRWPTKRKGTINTIARHLDQQLDREQHSPHAEKEIN